MDNRFEFNFTNFIRASLELVTERPLSEIDEKIAKVKGLLPRRKAQAQVVPTEEVVIPVQNTISVREYVANRKSGIK